MYGQDLLDAPIRHGLADKDRAGCDLMVRRTGAIQCRLDLAACEPVRGLNAAPNHLACLDWAEAFRGVIRLLGPGRIAILDQLHTATVHNTRLAVATAQGNEGSPPRMSLQPKGYSHGRDS
jgi:hypothetical protein